MGHHTHTQRCSKSDIQAFKKSYKILEKLLRDEKFVCAAKAASDPAAFSENVNVLLNAAGRFKDFRIVISPTDGRVFFDSARPVENHTGTFVLNERQMPVRINGAIEYQYANLFNLTRIEGKYALFKSDFLNSLLDKGYGFDVRWEFPATIGRQHFVGTTIGSLCDPESVFIRVSEMVKDC